MNQRQITAFRLVMNHGSITGAAQALNVSQPAVSRMIADLENALGFGLFLRRGGKIEPTAEALQFIQEVERMFYSLEKLKIAARDIKELRIAALRMASMPMISFDIVPQAIRRFSSRHDGIKITHNVYTSTRIFDLLAARQLELGVAQLPFEQREVDVIASYRSYCVCILPPDHPLAGNEEITPHDLSAHPIVALTSQTVTGNYVLQAFNQAGVSPDITIESQPSYSACGLTAAGLGPAIVDPLTPRMFADQLVVRPFQPRIPFDFHIIKPANMKLTRAASSFATELMEILKDINEIEPIRT